jgi:hypothetical protein
VGRTVDHSVELSATRFRCRRHGGALRCGREPRLAESVLLFAKSVSFHEEGLALSV